MIAVETERMEHLRDLRMARRRRFFAWVMCWSGVRMPSTLFLHRVECPKYAGKPRPYFPEPMTQYLARLVLRDVLPRRR